MLQYLILLLCTDLSQPLDETLFQPKIPTVNNPASRIINGFPAAKGVIPWQAAIYTKTNADIMFCGGALISPIWVLTAAHCTDGALAIIVDLGIVDLEERDSGVSVTASRVESHPSWSPKTFFNDIALVRLSQAVTYSNFIKPIELTSSATADDTLVAVSGWGKTSDEANFISTQLNYVGLVTVSNTECAQTYGPALLKGGIVCAKGETIESTCQGDSGGPLITFSGNKPLHVGVVSFGSTKGCAKGFLTAYTRTAAYLPWIKLITGI